MKQHRTKGLESRIDKSLKRIARIKKMLDKNLDKCHAMQQHIQRLRDK